MERDVKHGCCSCAYYKLPMSKEPCKSCERWSRWEDKDHEPITGEAAGAGADAAPGVGQAERDRGPRRRGHGVPV